MQRDDQRRHAICKQSLDHPGRAAFPSFSIVFELTNFMLTLWWNGEVHIEVRRS
jgi:hypothetical protein